jgi:hypothetical protein
MVNRTATNFASESGQGSSASDQRQLVEYAKSVGEIRQMFRSRRSWPVALSVKKGGFPPFARIGTAHAEVSAWPGDGPSAEGDRQ